ncbi:hypothetical protein F0L68_15630 [Solihabitans fulvus]|uniref:Uncharacterized protein n=1 Tax=Solihabitans fulvus TaxID=1892852 RepID=A0A5B2XFJ2_9PSEU|nr:hypothetical protein [Solihabitans fulvus]KAA2261680.1 hypothetical protein F0L68_15630 [Solihabitans fulvus]
MSGAAQTVPNFVNQTTPHVNTATSATHHLFPGNGGQQYGGGSQQHYGGAGGEIPPGHPTDSLPLGQHGNYHVYLDPHQQKHQGLAPITFPPGTPQHRVQNNQFTPNVNQQYHQNTFAPNAASIAQQGYQQALENRRRLDREARAAAQARTDARRAYGDAENRNASPAEMRQLRNAANQAEQRLQAANQAYSRSQIGTQQLDGYLNSNGQFHRTPQNSVDGVRYQVTANHTADPPYIVYHNYPETNVGGLLGRQG